MSSRSNNRLSTLVTRGSWPLAVFMAFGLGRILPQASTNQTDDENRIHEAPLSIVGEQGLGLSRPVPGPEPIETGQPDQSSPEGRPISTREINHLAKDAINGSSPLTRSLGMSKLLESLTPGNALSVMTALKENDADGDDWELFRYAWATVDPKGAMDHAMGLDGRARRDALQDTVTGWASHSPDDALAWLETLDDEDDRQRFRSSFVEGLADKDISRATEYVMKLAHEGDKRADRYLETVTREQLRKGTVQDAARWSENLPDGKLKGQAMDSVAGRFVRENPEGAAAWAARYVNEPYAARVIEEVADEWAERAPEASIAWLESLPAGQAQSEGMASAIDEWADRDPYAASAYLVDMHDSPTRDSAVGGFARSIARDDPEAAVAWATTITQNELRIKTLTRTAKEWFRRDSEAASEWLESSGLPQSTREVLRQGGRRG